MMGRARTAGVVLGMAVLAADAPAAQEIEEIIVTATKRERNLQDVAIAIDAFSREDLQDLGWTDVTQVANLSPNLDIKYAWGNSMPIYTLRGVGMNSFQASDTPSVGLFIDEVFQTSLAFMGAQLYDMERVEVLKGPQGALFGRNTNGGAVSYISRRPAQETDGYLRIDYGRFSRFEVEGAAGGALSDTVSGRASFMSIGQGDGWIHSRTTNEDIGEVDILAGRAQLLWEPGDDLSANLKVFASRDRSQPVYFEHIGFWQRGAPGTLCSPYLRTGRPQPTECVDVLGYSDTDGDPFAGDYTHRPDTIINSDAELENDSFGTTLTIDRDFGELSLTAITNYQEYDRYQPKESDGNPGLFVDFLFASDIEAISQEVRLTSSHDGPLNWILGAVYSRDEVSEDPPRIGFLDDYIGLRARAVYTQERTSIAGYGQMEWAMAERWRLSAGVRVINEDVDFVSEVAFLLPPAFAEEPRLVLATVPNPDFGVDGKLEDTDFTGRIAVDFTPTDDMLLYASIARGYKGGGFNGGLATNPRLYLPFDPEKVLAFEAGLKSVLANGRLRLNLATFVYDYEGVQAATPRVDPRLGTPLNFLTNLAAADVAGIEAELRWHPTDNLEINAGMGLLDTENNDPGANFDGPTGDAPRKLPNAPDLTFHVAARYEVPLGDGGRLRLFTDYAWMDDHYKEIVNNLEVESQALWNARITYLPTDGGWSVALWGRNLTDELYRVDTLTDPLTTGWGVYVNGLPRTYGVSLNYAFGG